MALQLPELLASLRRVAGAARAWREANDIRFEHITNGNFIAVDEPTVEALYGAARNIEVFRAIATARSQIRTRTGAIPSYADELAGGLTVAKLIGDNANSFEEAALAGSPWDRKHFLANAAQSRKASIRVLDGKLFGCVDVVLAALDNVAGPIGGRLEVAFIILALCEPAAWDEFVATLE